jgi:hypothetical protein
MNPVSHYLGAAKKSEPGIPGDGFEVNSTRVTENGTPIFATK